MARLLTLGAETNDLYLEGGQAAGAGMSIVSTPVRSGGYAFKQGNSGLPTVAAFTGVLGRTYFLRFYLRVGALPGSAARVLEYGSNLYQVYLDTDSTLQLRIGGTQIGSASAALTLDTWYHVELSCLIGSGAGDDAGELRLGGVSVASETAATRSTTAPVSIRFGAGGTVGDTEYMDDIALNDDQGADQNSWPGEGKQVLLLPISDNARATLWTGGAGGTTDLFDAVNNTPPIGTATETDLTQIEHAGGAAGTTDAYDANMTTYTTAGVGQGDTINVVQLVAAHGEDISTGAKLLAFSVVSNPAIATSGNVTAGDASPAALGTYPSEWGIHWGTATYNPAITVGTSPVMRVVRPETANRVASVCFMGMYVDYTPVAGRVPRSTPYPQLLAH